MINRRHWIAAAATPLPFSFACTPWPAIASTDTPTRTPIHKTDMLRAQADWAALETDSTGRLGVASLDTADGSVLQHRANERFPLCSTAKLWIAAAVLKQSTHDSGLLERRIQYRSSALVTYSPITQQHVDSGMAVAALCAAALQYSDNTAANLLMKLLGGPAAITAFARSVGDGAFRLDRWETALNSALPGDPRDTSTPATLAASLAQLTTGTALAPVQRAQLVTWLQGNTTGAARIRAGVPAGWPVGDKTGTGDYGTTNDVAVLWPPGRPPIVLVVLFTQPQPNAGPREDVVAAATRIALQAWAAPQRMS